MDQSAMIDKIVVTMVAASIVIWFVNLKISEQKCHPPGPRPSIPLIGYTREVSRIAPWLTYSAWAKQYGIPMIGSL